MAVPFRNPVEEFFVDALRRPCERHFVTRALLVVGVDSLGAPVRLHLLLYVLFIDLFVFYLFFVGLVIPKGAVMVPYTALSSPRWSSSSALEPSLSDRKVGLYLAGCFPGH